MDSGNFMAMMGGFPGASPFMFLNLSGICATTKIVQCTYFGIDSIDISRKFDKRPEDVSDLGAEDFRARKKILKQVEAWCKSMQGRPEQIVSNKWTPILYQYEIVKNSATKLRDWGHMVFVDYTVSRFLLIMVLPEDTCNCGNPFHDDYATLTEHHANRLMCLLKYIHYDPKSPQPAWVRATDTSPPIFHVTPKNFVASLLPYEIEKIDNLLAQKPGMKTASLAVRRSIMGSELTAPNTATAWLHGEHGLMRSCAYCNKVAENMPQCSRCKLVFYCGSDCQKLAWKNHKLVCKKATPAAA